MTQLKTLLLAAGAAVLAFSPAATSKAWAQKLYEPPAGQNIMGVWLVQGDQSTLKTVDGKLPPMKPAAKKAYDAAVKLRKAGTVPPGDTVAKCMPHGLPRLLLAPFPVEVLQEPQQVTFIHEAQHMPHLIYLDAKLPPIEDLDPNWMGFSAGRWDGNTLVVETAGMYDKTTLDKAGLPRSTKLKLTERIRKLDENTLEDVFTVEDADTYTKPWSARITFKRQPGYRLKQYVCTETNPEAK